jgi:hypothetical protein
MMGWWIPRALQLVVVLLLMRGDAECDARYNLLRALVSGILKFFPCRSRRDLQVIEVRPQIYCSSRYSGRKRRLLEAVCTSPTASTRIHVSCLFCLWTEREKSAYARGKTGKLQHVDVIILPISRP